MLVHDQYSGYIHEVPDQLYGLGEVYDGLGHPLGLPFLSALAPLASRLLPALAPIVSRIPGVGNLVGGALQNVGNSRKELAMLSVKRRSSRSMSRAKGSALQGKPLRILPGMPGFAPPLPAAPFMPGGMPRPWPLGWNPSIAALHRARAATALHALRGMAGTAGPRAWQCGEHVARHTAWDSRVPRRDGHADFGESVPRRSPSTSSSLDALA